MSKHFKILYIAEVVGKAGIYCLKKGLAELKAEGDADFVICCADGATNGNGLGRQHSGYIRKMGVDVITLGDKSFYKKDLTENMSAMPYILRPANLALGAPGQGSGIFKIWSCGNKIACAVLLGQSGFEKLHSENPFSGLPVLLERLRAETPLVIIDVHANASAEKQIIFGAADGLCTAVIGSGTRVQTTDERVLSGGTAVITDAGRTGSQLSVGGCDIKTSINEYISGIPDWTREAWDGLELCGVLIEADSDGKALSIQRIRRSIEGKPDTTQS